MRFLFPALFYTWIALAVGVLLLYLFRPRPRTVKTSTLPFFKWLAREHQDSTWLKRLKYLVSLLLSLLVVLCGAAALGRLVVSPSAGAVKTVVVLVDRSASLGATQGPRRTRLQAAVEHAKERLAGLPVGVGVVVMAYDQRPEVLLSRSVDRREVERSLDAIQVRPIAGRSEPALQLARQLAALEAPGIVWHVTDGEPTKESETTEKPVPEKSENETPKEASPKAPPEHESVAVEQILIGSSAINVGITAFQLRRLPLEKARFDAFVQIGGRNREPLPIELEVRLDDNLIALRKLTLKPNGQETLLVPVEASPTADRVLQLKVTAAGDSLAADDLVVARLPKLRPVKVLWVTESADPFTELALSSLGADNDVEVSQGGPASWPPKENQLPDVTIFDGWLPATWPTETPAIVLNPPKASGPLKAVRLASGLPIDGVRAPLESHPVLYGVATDRVAVTQTAMLAADGTLQPLWIGPQGPVLLAGESAGQRVVVMGFSPQQSEQLPLLASYPLLIGNAIYWSGNKAFESTAGMNRRTGELVELTGRQLTWKRLSPTDSDETIELSSNRGIALERVGLWETEAGEFGSAALLSADETVLPGEDDSQTGAALQAGAGWWARGDLLPVLLWLVFFVLIAESWLYHRYWVY